MLQFAFDAQGNPNPNGMMMAWAGVDAMYKQRVSALGLCLDWNVPETIVQSWPNGIGAYDGGIVVVKSGPNCFVWIGPGSGIFDYVRWIGDYLLGSIGRTFAREALSPAVSVSAITSSDVNAWINTLWAAYLLDIKGQVAAAVTRALEAGGRVQVVGFSLGGAMAVLFARFLAQTSTMNVDAIGFGQPRPLANSMSALPGAIRSFRITAIGDPVDLAPPTYAIVANGLGSSSLPTPTAWANYGTRYVVDQFSALTQVDDPPSPEPLPMAMQLTQLQRHHNNNYTQAISAYYVAATRATNTSRDANDYQNMAYAVDADEIFLVDRAFNTPTFFGASAALLTPISSPPARPSGSSAIIVSNAGDDVVMPPVWGKDP